LTEGQFKTRSSAKFFQTFTKLNSTSGFATQTILDLPSLKFPELYLTRNISPRENYLRHSKEYSYFGSLLSASSSLMNMPANQNGAKRKMRDTFTSQDDILAPDRSAMTIRTNFSFTQTMANFLPDNPSMLIDNVKNSYKMESFRERKKKISLKNRRHPSLITENLQALEFEPVTEL
jgi:hypothetical protein